MTTFFNTPYVDVRVDFNSWIPRGINKKLQAKLINFYLKKFLRNKHFHDKIEKNNLHMLFTQYWKKNKKRFKTNFEEIWNFRFYFKLKLINNLSYLEKNNDIKKINTLIQKQKKIENSDLYYFDKIYWHLENCKNLEHCPLQD